MDCGLPEDSERRAALEQVSIAWANTDLPAATAWVQAMPPGHSKEVAALSLGYEAARSEPLTALVVASALPPGPQRDDLLVHSISQWAAADPAVAADWAAEVPNVKLREHLLAAVAVSSAETDGAAAATLAAKSLGSGMNKTERWLLSCNAGRRIRQTPRLRGLLNGRTRQPATRPRKISLRSGRCKTARLPPPGCTNCRKGRCGVQDFLLTARHWRTATEARRRHRRRIRWTL